MTNLNPLIQLITDATELHKVKKQISLKSTLLIGRLDRGRAAATCGLSTADFARKIGLTPDQYFKRSQAARVLAFFPETKSLIESGELSVSGLTLLGARITQANKDIILSSIKGKSKRQINELLSRVTLDGQIIPVEPTVDLKFTLSKSQMAKLDRVLAEMTSRGETTSLDLVFEQALDALLRGNDPFH